MNVIDHITTEDVERVLASLPADHIIGDHSSCAHCTIASVAHILIEGTQYGLGVDIVCDYSKTDIRYSGEYYQVDHEEVIKQLIYKLDRTHAYDVTKRYVTAGEALEALRDIKKGLTL